MSREQFLTEHERRRGSLDLIVRQLDRGGPRRLAPEDAEQLVHLYRQVSADLARLRTGGADPQRLRQVNRLLVRAHGHLYRGRSRRGFPVWRFFAADVPRRFRANARFALASLLVSLLIYAMAYRTVQHHPEVVADILGGQMDAELIGERRPEDITGRFRTGQQMFTAPGFAAFFMTHNIRVALTAIALGLTFGLGTLYVLILNAAMLGGIAGAFAQSGIEGVLWTTILPHGALELSAVLVAGAAGLRMGWGLWCPGQRTRVAALRAGAADAAVLAVGLVPAFVVAGIIEGVITPSDRLGDGLKLAIGFAAAAAFWGHLALGGREG